MNNRRKFILQGGIAATAFLVAKPYKTFAKFNSPFTFANNQHKLLLLHTGHFTSPSAYTKTVSRIATLKSDQPFFFACFSTVTV